jgi:hypothetical protein
MAGLVPGITQDGCPFPADISVACRTLIIDTSKVKDFLPITYTATEEGGSSVTAGKIYIKVLCPDDLVITAPFPSQRTYEFKKGASPSTIEIGEFFTNSLECPIISYAAALVQGITQTDCIDSAGASDACSVFGVDTSEVKDFDVVEFTVTALGGSSI